MKYIKEFFKMDAHSYLDKWLIPLVFLLIVGVFFAGMFDLKVIIFLVALIIIIVVIKKFVSRI